MKKSMTILLMIFFFICSNLSGASQLRHLRQGDMLPGFNIRTIDGNPICLNDLKGKITVLAFWKLGQDDSNKMLVDLSRISKQYRDKGVKVLAINGNKASDQQIRQLSGTKNLNCVFAGDPDLITYGSIGIFVLPTTLIIGPDTRVTFIYSLYSRNFITQINTQVKILLGEITQDQVEAELHLGKSPDVSKARIKAERYINLGKMLMANPALKNKAFQVLTTAVQTDHSYYKPHVLLAKLHLENNMIRDAATELVQAFKLSPNLKLLQDARLLEARELADQGHDSQALSIFRKWLNDNQKPPAALYFTLGRIYEKQNRMSLATEAYYNAAETMLSE
jgi:peroxiredoxin/predicted negative regulator of RcsB-dependent stress response